MIMKIIMDIKIVKHQSKLSTRELTQSIYIVGHENIYLVKSAVSEDLTKLFKLFLHVELYLFDISDHDHDTSYKL